MHKFLLIFYSNYWNYSYMHHDWFPTSTHATSQNWEGWGGRGKRERERERERETHTHTHTHMVWKKTQQNLTWVQSHVFGAKLSSRWSIRILHDEVWWTWENYKPLQGCSDSKMKEVLSSRFLMMGGELGQWDSRFYSLWCSNEKWVIISLKCLLP
jgi:hypothetical protein